MGHRDKRLGDCGSTCGVWGKVRLGMNGFEMAGRDTDDKDGDDGDDGWAWTPFDSCGLIIAAGLLFFAVRKSGGSVAMAGDRTMRLCKIGSWGLAWGVGERSQICKALRPDCIRVTWLSECRGAWLCERRMFEHGWGEADTWWLAHGEVF